MLNSPICHLRCLEIRAGLETLSLCTILLQLSARPSQIGRMCRTYGVWYYHKYHSHATICFTGYSHFRLCILQYKSRSKVRIISTAPCFICTMHLILTEGAFLLFLRKTAYPYSLSHLLLLSMCVHYQVQMDQGPLRGRPFLYSTCVGELKRFLDRISL